MNEESLRATGLVKDYSSSGASATRALRGVDFAVSRGELCAVVGPSGAGKTTLLYLLGGLARPSQGEVWVGGQPIFRLDDGSLSRLRNRRLGFVFQYHHLLPEFDATDNVALPLRVGGLGVEESRGRSRVLLRKMGLGARLDHRPGELSGGEQQRVAVARALISDPAVVLADEPTGNLDKANSEAVFALLQQAAHAGGQAVVLVTHNADLARRADRTVRMEDGAIL
ncbi:MAG TPA: ABC transporter ATP-binding protein [bacterium]|jgi:ABC-type lipoprotein export system ATPase subunit|nr:ABC transporter ATP-binding protein [bacterium]